MVCAKAQGFYLRIRSCIRTVLRYGGPIDYFFKWSVLLHRGPIVVFDLIVVMAFDMGVEEVVTLPGRLSLCSLV